MRFYILIAALLLATGCGSGQSPFMTNLGGSNTGDAPAGSIFDAALADGGGTGGSSGGSNGGGGGGAVNPGTNPGTPGGTPVDPPDPDPDPGADGIEIDSFVKLPGEQNDTFWSWDWEVEVFNHNTFPVDVLVRVTYYDADFNVLHEDQQSIHIDASGNAMASGTSELSPEDGANVAAVEASIELEN